MAKQITNIKRLEVSEKQIKQSELEEITDALSDNKESIIKGIDLLTTLDENGTLDFLNALIKTKEEAMKNIIQELNKEQYSGFLENAGDLIFLLGELDLKRLKDMTERLNEGMEEALATDENDKTTYMGMLKALKEPEINRSITMLLTFMRGMGRE